MIKTWTPASWRQKSCAQWPDYPCLEEVAQIERELATFPSLIEYAEINTLKRALARVSERNAFLLQGGDCAERFEDCNATSIKSKLQFFESVRHCLKQQLNCEVISVGRIAGQYAKPRSNLYEIRHTFRLPSYQGDMINENEFDAGARTPKPSLMKQAYFYAAKTLSFIKAYSSHFYTSHEALLLPYEQALTRNEKGKWYNVSTHFPWVGYRTNQIEGAHIDYVCGIENPIAIKLGEQSSPDFLQALALKLNPQRDAGRLTFITRLGAEKVCDVLPAWIDAVSELAIPVIWSCDPMHGNTKLLSSGIKTRFIEEIIFELSQTLRIHREKQSYLGGVHLEMTHENVIECVGGASGFVTTDLTKAYVSPVDPRLNSAQVDEVLHVFKVS